MNIAQKVIRFPLSVVNTGAFSAQDDGAMLGGAFGMRKVKT